MLLIFGYLGFGNYGDELLAKILSEQLSETQTQEANNYSFSSTNCGIGLIDTPGIGNTRGIEQNKINIRSFVKALKASKNINALCLVIKGTDTRVDASLRYQMNQYKSLMTKEAQNNIVVCFTDVIYPDRIEAKHALIEGGIITEDTPTFYFDNSCLVPLDEYKLISWRKKEKKRQIETYKWNSNYMNAQQMILKISQMKEISGSSILDLYLKRDLAYQKANQEIQKVKLFQQHQKNLESQLEDLKNIIKKIELSNDLKVNTKKKVEVKKIRKEMQKVQKELEGNKHATLCVNHNGRCHEICGLNRLSTNGDSAFMSCSVFQKKENCNVCGCHYKYHLHDNKYFVEEMVDVEYTDLVETDEVLTDEELKKQNEELRELKENKERYLKDAKKKLDQLQSEKKKNSDTTTSLIGDFKKDSPVRNEIDVLLDYFQFKKKLIEVAYNKGSLTKTELDEEISRFTSEIDTYKHIQDIVKSGKIDDEIKKEAQQIFDEEVNKFIKEMKQYKEEQVQINKRLQEKQGRGIFNTIGDFLSKK